MKIVTHSGKFHADEVFAVATLFLAYKNERMEIIRTRDPEIIKTADIVVDVGGEYDSGKKRFDHHQQQGAGVRENGIPYSSFGIVWKVYGNKVCGSQTVSEIIDKTLVVPIDALDNGVVIQKPIMENVHDYTVGDLIDVFNPSWKESVDRDESFKRAVQIAKEVLTREVIRTEDKEEGKIMVDTLYVSAPDKRIIILENYLPWGGVISAYSEPLFVVYPNSENKNWHVQTVRDIPHLFTSRKDFPREWGGKVGRELAEITGVKGAIFCHKNLFLCGAETKEDATKLAKLALDA